MGFNNSSLSHSVLFGSSSASSNNSSLSTETKRNYSNCLSVASDTTVKRRQRSTNAKLRFVLHIAMIVGRDSRILATGYHAVNAALSLLSSQSRASRQTTSTSSGCEQSTRRASPSLWRPMGSSLLRIHMVC